MSDTMPTVCHFCGSKVIILRDGSECKADDGSCIGFQCGTSWHRGYHNPRQLQSRSCEINERDALKTRIKRLEDAGDFLSRYLREMPYASDYLAQVDERILRISNWRRAKEDNL